MSTLTERDALLAAVLAAPDDDLPRLVYADWLDEHGEDRWADLIRVQCELAATESYRQRKALAEREREVFARLTGGGLPDDGLPAGCVVTLDAINLDLGRTYPNPGFPVAFVRRGFVDEVRLPLPALTGRVCEGCGGSGLHRYYHPVEIEGIDDCPGCVGGDRPGHVGGCVSGMFRSHPVTTVWLTDREPYHNLSRRCAWANCQWLEARLLADPFRLPAELFTRLPHKRPGRKSVADYDTPELAQADLSAAGVTWGRELADLPPLGLWAGMPPAPG